MLIDYPKGPVWVRFLSDRVFDPVFDPVFGGFFEHLAKMKHAHSKPDSVFSECSVQCSMGLFRTVPLRSGLGPVWVRFGSGLRMVNVINVINVFSLSEIRDFFYLPCVGQNVNNVNDVNLRSP